MGKWELDVCHSPGVSGRIAVPTIPIQSIYFPTVKNIDKWCKTLESLQTDLGPPSLTGFIQSLLVENDTNNHSIIL